MITLCKWRSRWNPTSQKKLGLHVWMFDRNRYLIQASRCTVGELGEANATRTLALAFPMLQCYLSPRNSRTDTIQWFHWFGTTVVRSNKGKSSSSRHIRLICRANQKPKKKKELKTVAQEIYNRTSSLLWL